MRKKSILVLTLSIMMAVIMTLMPSVQVAAEQAKKQGEYIAEEAEKALDSYTIMKEGNQNVDLNEKSGRRQ